MKKMLISYTFLRVHFWEKKKQDEFYHLPESGSLRCFCRCVCACVRVYVCTRVCVPMHVYVRVYSHGHAHVLTEEARNEK